MLGAYLSSVIIWTAILYATVKLLIEELVDKGWTDGRKHQRSGILFRSVRPLS